MAPARSAELKTAIYQHPINASSDPTPVKPPSQQVPYITQVPRSPCISQSTDRDPVPQTDCDELVQDSLEYQRPAPIRQPSTLPKFLEPSAPIHHHQPVKESCEEEIVAPSQPAPDILQSSIEVPSHKQSPSGNHTIEQDSVQLAPRGSLLPERNYQEDSGQTQPLILSQRNATTAVSTPVHSPVHIDAAYDDDNDDENIAACITVRPQAATPPAKLDTRTSSSAGIPSAFRGIEDIYSETPLNRTGSSQLNVSATTAFTTPSMPPKTSATKGTSTSQARKAAGTTSKKPSKPAPPLPKIVNQGETSSSALLRQKKAGVTSQTNTTRQSSEGGSKAVPRDKVSQKATARPSQVSATKPVPKPVQQRQSQSQKLPAKQSSRKAEASEGRGEYDLSPDPDVDEQSIVLQRAEKVNPRSTRATKSTPASVAPGKNDIKGRPKKKAAKVPTSDEDDDDEEYNAPKSHRSKAAATTRASTRAQTQKATKNDGLNISTRSATASEVPKKGKSVSQKIVPPDREEAIEDFEDSMTHINSGGAAEPHFETQLQPAKPREVETSKPRRRTEKEAQLMQAISSPDRTTTPAVSQLKARKEPVIQKKSSSIPQQGTTRHHPVKIDDNDLSQDDEDAMNEGLDASYNDTINEVMSQDTRDKQQTPLTTNLPLESHFGVTYKSPTRPSAAHTANSHSVDLLAQERAQRKPNFVGFGVDGPKNQGSRHSKKPSIHDPVAREASSPDVHQSVTEELPPVFNETSGSSSESKKGLDLNTPAMPAHVDTVASALYTPSEQNPTVQSKAADGQIRKTAVSIEVSAGEGVRSTESRSSMRPVVDDHNHPNTRSMRDIAEEMPLNENQKVSRSTNQSEPMVEDATQQTRKEPRNNEERLHSNKVAARSSAPLVCETAQLESHIPREPTSASLKGSVVRTHTQASSTQVNAQVFPQIAQLPDIDEASKASGSKASMFPAEDGQGNVIRRKLQASQVVPPDLDRKRPSTEMTGAPAKRPRAGLQSSHAQSTQASAATNPVLRKLSQVNDNGSPIPYREDIPQESPMDPQARQKRTSTSLFPTSFPRHQNTDDTFARVLASKRKQAIGSEGPWKEMHALSQDAPGQVSQAMWHAGSDGDTLVTAEYNPVLELQKNLVGDTLAGPQESPPPKAHTTQRTLGLMEHLQSRVVSMNNAQGVRGEGEKDPEVDETMEEDDPDKTLVNESSDDGDDDDDDDDDGSESRNSSDTDGEDGPKDALSMWRNALESHQGDVHDQLIRIAHRLTSNLKDHESAIKDISTDYKRDGARLIERLEKDNEARLEQYCIKRTKMQERFVRGYEQTRDGLRKDLKDMEASSGKYVKRLSKQVDAEGRLDQILQAYHQ